MKKKQLVIDPDTELVIRSETRLALHDLVRSFVESQGVDGQKVKADTVTFAVEGSK
jgi:hypothetical protein